MIKANDSKEFKDKQFEIKYAVDRPAVFVYGKGKKRANCFTSLFCFICKDILIALCIAILGGILTELFIRNCLPSTQTLSVQIASSSQSIDQSSFNLYLDNCIIEKSKVHRSGFNQVSFQYKSHGKHILGIEIEGNQKAVDQFKTEQQLIWGNDECQKNNIAAADTTKIDSMVYHKSFSSDDLIQSKFLFFTIRRPQPEKPTLVFVDAPIEPSIYSYNPTINFINNNQTQIINQFNFNIYQTLFPLTSKIYLISDDQLLKYVQNFSIDFPPYDKNNWYVDDLNDLKAYSIELSKILRSTILILPYIEQSTSGSAQTKVLISFTPLKKDENYDFCSGELFYNSILGYYFHSSTYGDIKLTELLNPYCMAYKTYQRVKGTDNQFIKENLDKFRRIKSQIPQIQPNNKIEIIQQLPQQNDFRDLIQWTHNSLTLVKADRGEVYIILKNFWDKNPATTTATRLSSLPESLQNRYKDIVTYTKDFCTDVETDYDFCSGVISK